MKVSELIEKLKKLPKDKECFVECHTRKRLDRPPVFEEAPISLTEGLDIVAETEDYVLLTY